MKIAFPTNAEQGLESPVYGHFGSAQAFVIIESDTEEIDTVVNRDRVHAHGQCQPLAALGGIEVGAVVVGGIGAGALQHLNAAGVQVFRAIEGTIQENLEFIKHNKLPRLTLDQTCAGHDHQGGGCVH